MQTLTGKACNGKAGAVLVTADNGVVYVGGLNEWPDNLCDKRVTGTGTLEGWTAPSARLPNGEYQQTCEGDQTTFTVNEEGFILLDV